MMRREWFPRAPSSTIFQIEEDRAVRARNWKCVLIGDAQKKAEHRQGRLEELRNLNPPPATPPPALRRKRAHIGNTGEAFSSFGPAATVLIERVIAQSLWL
jgi:hypothetical protein